MPVNPNEAEQRKAVILLNEVESLYPLIKVPKNTLIFHSNTYFYEDIMQLENFEDNMFIQDIKRYVNKIDGIDSYLNSESYPRTYANFTYAANIAVKANLNVSEHIYCTTEDLYFVQLPVHTFPGPPKKENSIKDQYDLTSTSAFKEYIKYRNLQRKQSNEPPISGIIAITNVDGSTLEDPNVTRWPNNLSTWMGSKEERDKKEFYYPEIIILDGFDKYMKIGQWDLYDLSRDYTRTATRHPVTQVVTLPKFTSGDDHLVYLQNLLDFTTDIIQGIDPTTGVPKLKPILNDFTINKIIPIPLDSYFDYVITNIGNFGNVPMNVYQMTNLKNFCKRDAFQDDDEF
jgi:hypothetical protein